MSDLEQKWIKAQELEEEWWANTNFNPQVEWSYYLHHFAMHIKPDYDAVIDVGSGPCPFICNPVINSHLRVVVDPLWPRYIRMKRYNQWRCNIHKSHADLSEVMSGQFNAAFCLNTLDHVKDPLEMVKHLQRIIRPYGQLFLFVDVNKPPDRMHPHCIQTEWLVESLSPLARICLHVEKSWKFENDVLYYVGKKIPLGDSGE